MLAAILNRYGAELELCSSAKPEPDSSEVQIRVYYCGLCRTDLHIIDGELHQANLPRILGHQIVGVVSRLGKDVRRFSIGDVVGVPWLGGVCGVCEFCKRGEENLCDAPVFTGYQKNGGFAEYASADSEFCVPLLKEQLVAESAPLLCAGLIGYRTLRKAKDAKHIGIFGFGAAAHIVAQICKYEGRKFYAFVRAGDNEAKSYAQSLGAEWAGDSTAKPEQLLDAALIFAPVGELVPHALKLLRKGGKVICGGIHMSDIPGFPYSQLWGEREIVSVANLTRNDSREFFEIAPKIPIKTEVTVYNLKDINLAINTLRQGKVRGAVVVRVGE